MDIEDPRAVAVDMEQICGLEVRLFFNGVRVSSLAQLCKTSLREKSEDRR